MNISIKSLAKKELILIVMILGVIILLVPQLIRDTPIGSETYFFDRLSESTMTYDDLSYEGRPFLYSYGTPLVYSVINQIPVYLITTILGILSLLFFYLVLINLNTDKEAALIMSFILLISPPFLYTFTSITIFTFPIFIILLASFLYTYKIKSLQYTSLLLFAITPFFGLTHALISLFLLIVLYYINKRKKLLITSLIITGLITLILEIPKWIRYGFPQESPFAQPSMFNIISDFSSLYGLSIFALIAALIGINYLWREKYKHKPLYLTFIFLIILVFFNNLSVIYLNFLICGLAGYLFIHLASIKWESPLIKKLTTFILILGILFSSVSYITYLYHAQPSKELTHSLSLLKDATRPDTTIFSHYSNGIYINSITGRKNFMDAQTDYAPNLYERYNTTQKIFFSRNINTTLDLLKENNIDYILITKDMKQGLVWTSEDEGLLFLLKYYKDFQYVYLDNNIEVWEVL